MALGDLLTVYGQHINSISIMRHIKLYDGVCRGVHARFQRCSQAFTVFKSKGN